MAQSQNSAVVAISLVSLVSQHLQFWLRRVLLWLIDEEGEATVKKIVNEDSDDDDEGYNSIISTTEIEASNHRGRRRKPREEELNIVAENTKEELREKFILLREAYDDLKDVMTRLEFEVDYLKDDQDEREEEMRLQRTELMHLVELIKVMKEEKEGDKNIIRRQQEIIDKWAREGGGCQEEEGAE
eukprot:GFUD01096576.1.p1 GENE.GFUD01096576.1~~GFUD01096576.1.p1  ORF type:complete len:197 (+),score=89.74 GFUD01096576.1:35-592(+)